MSTKQRAKSSGGRIAFLSSELAPFAKAGGLGDVSAALPRYLHGAGHDVRVFAPLYARVRAALDKQLVPVEFAQNVHISTGPHNYWFSLYTAPVNADGMNGYFIDCPVLYDRDSLYTSDSDEHLRFIVLTRAAIESCQRMGFSPHVLHCNDWQGALAPLYLKTLYGWDRLFAETRTLLTIHNIGYQGVFGTQAVTDSGLAAYAGEFHQEDLAGGMVNFLKTGILHADGVSTVSPTYAREIQGPEFGAGLDGLLRQRKERLVGILNGVDYEEWSPETDTRIPKNYSREDRSGKAECKRALLAQLGLPPANGAPLAGIVSRLTSQKGFELLFEALPRILQRSTLRLVVLGSGESQYENFFSGLQYAFRDRVCFYRGYNDDLAHLIEAGADMFLMPSLYEPCGLNQMYSLRYGTIPVVRRTGGLADTVQTFDPDTGAGNGVVFDHFDATAAAWALRTALRLYDIPAAWQRMIDNGMACDYSWQRQGAVYEELYRRLTAL